MSKLLELEAKIKRLEEQVKKNTIEVEVDNTKYPIIIGHRKWVSKDHWYYC